MIFIFGIMFVSFVFAQGQGVHEPGTGIDNPELKEAGQGTGQGLEDGMQVQAESQTRVRTGDYFGEDGKKIKIQERAENRVRLEVNGVGVDCDCELNQEMIQNRTKLKTQLSNGRNAEIKIMPDSASETALNRLRLKVCNSENNCSIELKEVGSGDGVKLAYELKAEKQVKFLGLFKVKSRQQTQVDAENGEIVQVKKPWWSFLASEPGE